MLRMRKRIGAAFMAAALLIGQLGATAYAEGPPDATGGLCEHHTIHDAACGYVESIPGGDCEHKHTTDCYSDELICGYEVDAEQTATNSDAGHKHGQACYALDCPHERGEHGDGCGYIEAVPGTPCGYVCDLCGKEPDKDSGEAGATGGNGLPAPGEPEPIEPSETQVRQEAALLAGPDLDDKNNDGYHDGDVTAFQQILADHPSLKNVSGVKVDDPASWNAAGLVRWDTSSPKRLYYLSLYDKGLTGTLDVGNLTALTELSCGNNPYTSFTTKDGHTLTVTPAANGKVWLTNFDKDSSTVQLDAKPDSGYTFQVWSGLPVGAPDGQTTSFILKSDTTVSAAFRPIGADATLKSLSLSSGTLTPAFSPATTSYTATVDYSVSNVTITARANDTKASVTVIGVKPLKVGENEFTIIVTAENGDKKTYTVTITREKAPTIPVTGVTLDKSAYTLYTNKDPRSFQLTAKVEPSNASNKTVSWQSSDNNVAKVDGNGNVTAIAKGTATITVTTTDGRKTAACTVTVETDTSGNGGGGRQQRRHKQQLHHHHAPTAQTQ